MASVSFLNAIECEVSVGHPRRMLWFEIGVETISCVMRLRAFTTEEDSDADPLKPSFYFIDTHSVSATWSCIRGWYRDTIDNVGNLRAISLGATLFLLLQKLGPWLAWLSFTTFPAIVIKHLDNSNK